MLKKLALIVAVIMIVKAFPFGKTIFKAEIGEYTFYLGSASSNCEMVTTSASKASELRKSLKNVCGESLKTQNSEIIDGEISRLGAELVFEEQVNGIDIKYYYSNKITTYKTINGKKINVQTACGNGNFTIGSPLIFGSF